METAILANPFPGLRSYNTEESHLFFGRDDQIDELLRKIRVSRFLALIGNSGSGKSSLVKSGLIPILKDGFMGQAGNDWVVTTFRPGYDPIGNLAKALAQPNVFHPDEPMEPSYPKSVEDTLRRSSMGLVRAFRKSKVVQEKNLLIFVDQFEELFKYHEREKSENEGFTDAVSFVNLLLATSEKRDVPIYILLTMRSDFLGDTTEFIGLPEAINEGQYLIPRMKKEDIRSAIVGPVTLAGASITARLRSQILIDVSKGDDQLPIMQHALMRMWDHWADSESDGPLDLEHYKAIGTMENALSWHAEEAYEEISEYPRKTYLCERMFKALTDKSSEGRGVRRPVQFGVLCKLCEAQPEELMEVIDVFRKKGRGFLQPGAGKVINDYTYVNISHESFMRVWQRLSVWVDEELHSAEIYQRLAADAMLFWEGKKDFWRDPELALGLEWFNKSSPNAVWAQRYNPNFNDAIDFLFKSKEEADRIIAQKEEQRRLQLARARAFNRVVGFAAVIGIMLAIVSILLFAKSKVQANLAEQAKSEAEYNSYIASLAEQKAEENAEEARNLADLAKRRGEEAEVARRIAEEARNTAISQAQIAIANQQRAVVSEQRAIDLAEIAQENLTVAQREKLKAIKSEAAAREQTLIAEEKTREAELERDRVQKMNDLERSRSESLESARLIEGGDLSTGALKALEAYELNKRINGPRLNKNVYDALLKALFAAKSDDYNSGLQSGVRDIAFHPERAEFIAGCENGSVHVLRIVDGKLRRGASMVIEDERVRTLDYSKDGKFVALGTVSGQLIIYRQTQGRLTEVVRNSFGAIIQNLGFLNTEAGNYLALTTVNSVYLVRVQGAQIRIVDQASHSHIGAMGISEGGKHILIGDLKTCHVYRVDENDISLKNSATISTNATITSLALDARSKFLAVGLVNGTLVLNELGTGFQTIRSKVVPIHRSLVSSLSFHNFDTYLQLASSGFDQTLSLMDVSDVLADESNEDFLKFKSHTKWVYKGGVSTNGKYLVSASEDGQVTLWFTSMDDLADEVRKISKE